jgi:polysaccharide export outer membrane protein
MIRLPAALALLVALAACSGAALDPPAAPAMRGGPSIAYAPPQARVAPTSAPSAPGALPAAEVVRMGAPQASPAPAPALATTASATGGARPFSFRFQVGDEVGIDVWQEKDLSVVQRVLRDGTIAPPLLDPLPVTGHTVSEVRTELLARYREYLREPRITVRVVSVQSDRVFVLGEVRTPSAVTSVGDTTLLQAVAQAGGFVSEAADLQRVRVVRPSPTGTPPRVMTVNARTILAGRAGNPRLQPGDIVFVPPTGLADWSRSFTQAISPIAALLGAAGSVGTTALAIDSLNK